MGILWVLCIIYVIPWFDTEQDMPDTSNMASVDAWKRRHFSTAQYTPESLCLANTPSLCHLSLDFTSLGIWELLFKDSKHSNSSEFFDQLFSHLEWTNTLPALTGPSCVFPASLHCSCLESLKLVVGFLLPWLQDYMWNIMHCMVASIIEP